MIFIILILTFYKTSTFQKWVIILIFFQIILYYQNNLSKKEAEEETDKKDLKTDKKDPDLEIQQLNGEILISTN